MAFALSCQGQDNQRNINDIFNDRKSILEFDIGLIHFNVPIFKLIPDEGVAVIRRKIHTYLPLDLFGSVVHFEGNARIHNNLIAKYNKINEFYNPFFSYELIELGKLIQEFQDLHYNFHIIHNVQRIRPAIR
ncbi:MAG: hypothetical protein HEEMFOPI_00691 [Holosporales bacterium]